MAAPPDVDNLPAGAEVGFYRVVRRIAAGGFGTLYEVERDGKAYALKIARERVGALGPAEGARFEDRIDREVASLKQLSHPNIVKVFALDRFPDLENGHPYLVLELVRGEELRQYCRRTAPSAVALCVLFEKLARAVHYMHERQLFHRDLKSENVLVRGSGDPVIVDFGIARGRASFRVTRHEGMVGTATHYAPEYLRHRETEAYERGEEFAWTAATDLHAVGYLLYEALTGRPPFEGDDELELWRAIREDLPPRPSQVNEAVPRSLDQVVMRLLAKDPLDRHSSGLQLAEELRTLSHRFASKPNWAKPLRTPEPIDGGSVAGAAPEPANLEDIDELRVSPIALAAADLVRKGSPASAPRSPENPAVTPLATITAAPPPEPAGAERGPGTSSAVEKLRLELARASPDRARWPRSIAIGCAAALFLFLAGAVFAASRRGEPRRPTSLMAKVTRERSLDSSPVPAARPTVAIPDPRLAGTQASSALSLADARAIDRELEARYGGRPTVTPEGGLENITPARSVIAEDPSPGHSKPLTPVKATSAGDAAPVPPHAPPVAPAWLKRSTSLDTRMLVAQGPALPPRPLGIPTGTHILARLLTALDSRTVANGPAEARLPRPLVLRDEVVLPAGTLAFGRATSVDGRFVVHFDRLRLPDDRELEIAAIAIDRSDDKPGLAASRSLPGESHPYPGGAGLAIARTSAQTVLDTVSGGLAQDLVRGAGQTALETSVPTPTTTAGTELLDPGLLFDLWVERPF